MYMIWLALFLASISATMSSPLNSTDSNLVVQTSNGLIKGKLMKTFNKNTEYLGFFKIPFAKSPTGSRRFSAPEPSDPWNGIYDATKEGEQCVQYAPNQTVVGSEDCLFLRVYVPKGCCKDDHLLPVMYYVHGGAFQEGSPNFDEYGPDLFMEKGVILALVQYRLGFYGFCSTEDMVCPGNNGLKDQRLGLRWIKRNAKAFGGDPDKITIFGHSSGSACIGYLVNTPTTAGLFQAAIQQSGAEIGYWARQQHAKEKMFSIGKRFGISTNNSKELIEKLKKVDSKRLFETSTAVAPKDPIVNVPYNPVIEPDHPDAILTQKPLQQLQNGDYNRVPIIIGFTSLEALDSKDMVNNTKVQMKRDKTILVPNTIFPKDNATKMHIADQIYEYYFNKNDFDYGLLRYVSDNFMVRCVLQKSHLISVWSPTYLYKFSYIGVLGDPTNRNRGWGVGHTEELGYMFHKTGEPTNVPESDTRVRYQLVTLWTDFAKTLNPTPTKQSLLDNVTWPRFTQRTDYQSLSIDEKLTIKKRVNETDLQFWHKMFTYDTAHVGWY